MTGMIISQNPPNHNRRNDAQYHYPGGPNQMVKVGHAGIANSPCASADLVFTPLELQLLDRLHKHGADPPAKNLSAHIIKLARLGGYLARAHDGPSGNTVVWRGISRLTDIQLGFLLGAQIVGN